jgi:hypothetical protein
MAENKDYLCWLVILERTGTIDILLLIAAVSKFSPLSLPHLKLFPFIQRFFARLFPHDSFVSPVSRDG